MRLARSAVENPSVGGTGGFLRRPIGTLLWFLAPLFPLLFLDPPAKKVGAPDQQDKQNKGQEFFHPFDSTQASP